ncbi:reverse transcriptase-like protein, partial [Sarcoptes scabiei]
MGFRINFNKSATNLDHPIQEAAQGVTIPQLVETYTYLGVEEDGSARSKASLMQANIERIENRILERVDQLTETGLSGKNLFIAINEFATVIANYYDGLVNMTSEHFDSIDLKIRRMLYAKRMIFRSANIDRLY